MTVSNVQSRQQKTNIMSATASAPKARTVLGMKWYPMTLRPAAPYAFVMAGFYYAMTQFDAKIRAGKHGKLPTSRTHAAWPALPPTGGHCTFNIYS